MKLAILDKDGTLVKPKSGNTFVQHPEDQELLPGVEKAIAALVEQDYTLAIASNQGGCAIQSIQVSKVTPGMYLQLAGEVFIKVIENVLTPAGERVYSVLHCSDGDILTLDYFDAVEVCYKTIDDAINEMRFVRDLTGIGTAYFCPDFEGKECYAVSKIGCYPVHKSDYAAKLIGSFRKPGKGMLTNCRELMGLHPESCLMIGDRPEDEGAAQAAGIPFMWADEWRKPFI